MGLGPDPERRVIVADLIDRCDESRRAHVVNVRMGHHHIADFVIGGDHRFFESGADEVDFVGAPHNHGAFFSVHRFTGDVFDEFDQLLELDWIRLGRRRMTPGRPVTFVVTEQFLDHFGLESARDLPGLKELRAAGLLDNRPLPGGLAPPSEDDDGASGQSELFEE